MWFDADSKVTVILPSALQPTPISIKLLVLIAQHSLGLFARSFSAQSSVHLSTIESLAKATFTSLQGLPPSSSFPLRDHSPISQALPVTLRPDSHIIIFTTCSCL